jgi:hypothetical protein
MIRLFEGRLGGEIISECNKVLSGRWQRTVQDRYQFIKLHYFK